MTKNELRNDEGEMLHNLMGYWDRDDALEGLTSEQLDELEHAVDQIEMNLVTLHQFIRFSGKQDLYMDLLTMVGSIYDNAADLASEEGEQETSFVKKGGE